MPKVAGKRVVVFGDSLSAGPSTPGQVLAGKLASAGADVRVFARVGRSAHNFYGREDHAALLAQVASFRPDLAIVVLGTNDVGLSLSVDQQAMARLKRDLGAGGAEVWAFGPPAFATSARIHDGAPAVAGMMRTVFGARFLDLHPLTSDLTGSAHRAADKIHFTSAGGKLAGERMADRFHAAESGSMAATAALAVAVVAYYLLR